MTNPTAAPAQTMWSRLADLPVTIDQATIRPYALEGATAFTRKTTEIVLTGGGHEGIGEEVSYMPADHEALPPHFEAIIGPSLVGEWTMASFSDHVAGLQLYADAPDPKMDGTSFRIWALESAALDLALRQAGTTLAVALGRSAAPVKFCLSMGLGTPPDTAKVHGWIAARPGTTFKLDSNNEWTADIMRELAATGAVDVVDIKGHYEGDWLDNTPVPDVYHNIAELLPDAIIEDPKLTDETTPALGDAALARIAYDAPIHSLDDLLACDPRPAKVNIKPTRFGAISSLLETIEWCEAQGIPMYGGGQFELAWGRTQAQTIAAIFYADAANDVAPAVFHSATPGDDVPASPLTIPDRPGFGFPTSA